MKLYLLFSLTLALPTTQICASKPGTAAAVAGFDASKGKNALCLAVSSTDQSSLGTMTTLLAQGVDPQATFDDPYEDLALDEDGNIHVPKITALQLAQKKLSKYKRACAQLDYLDLRKVIPLFESKVAELKKAEQKSSKS